MSRNQRSIPEISTGSMADIAFLLLIFFLVTTTIETDAGIYQKLLPLGPDIPEAANVPERNLWSVILNGEDRLMVNGTAVLLPDLRQRTIDFLDNNGDRSCTSCKGLQRPDWSEHPSKAVITLQNDRSTSYRLYIAVHNELSAAYSFLRERESQQRFGLPYSDLEAGPRKAVLRTFPQKIIEIGPLEYPY